MDSCERDNKLSDNIKGGEFVGQLSVSQYHRLRLNFIHWKPHIRLIWQAGVDMYGARAVSSVSFWLRNMRQSFDFKHGDYICSPYLDHF
jgi:hypothetical protein